MNAAVVYRGNVNIVLSTVHVSLELLWFYIL